MPKPVKDRMVQYWEEDDRILNEQVLHDSFLFKLILDVKNMDNSRIVSDWIVDDYNVDNQIIADGIVFNRMIELTCWNHYQE